MIILDTSILAYAVGAAHPFREPCRRILGAHAEGRIEATTTVEVIQEFTHVRARRMPRREAVEVARKLAAAFDLLATTPEELDRGLHVFERYETLGAFDAVLVAVAMSRGAEALVSADRSFGSVPGLRWVDPAGPALRRLIGDD